MVENDLSVWLKAAAENKITTKNTWKSTLIEHFSDISNFVDQKSVNFQKAGCALEGSMKVYSTRVDDVSEHTNKLLELFSKEDTKTKKTRSTNDYIEKKISNINIKEENGDLFYDGIFQKILNKEDGRFLIDVLDEKSEGICIFEKGDNDIIYEDKYIDFECTVLPLCWGLRNIQTNDEENLINENLIDNKIEENLINENLDSNAMEINKDNNETIYNSDDNGFEINLDENGIEDNLIGERVENFVLCDTPFGYFKGWAGPSYWKTEPGRHKIKRKKEKEKEVFFYDFSADYDFSVLHDKTENAIMTKEAILKRRQNKNLLPEDFYLERKDLYKFIIKDGYFNVREKEQNANKDNLNLPQKSEEYENDQNQLSLDSDNLNSYNCPANDSCNSFDLDDDPMVSDLSRNLENSLVLENLTHSENSLLAKQKESGIFKPFKAPKRIDIKKLKEKITGCYKENLKTLSGIYGKIASDYKTKENKDISPHLCLISILHLANENGIELSKNNGDIILEFG